MYGQIGGNILREGIVEHTPAGILLSKTVRDNLAGRNGSIARTTQFAKIAVGSGCFLGKGYLQGTQTQLKFLPQQHTDFVFSVFAEEWGFIGGLILIIIFMSIILWGLKIALQARDLLGTIIAFGITALISWEVFINIGMVLGILPVVGIPLPFLSYGGSAMVCLLAAVGLLMNVSVRRFILKN